MVANQRRFWIAVSLLLAALFFQLAFSRGDHRSPDWGRLETVPYQVGSWWGTDLPMDSRVLEKLNLDGYLQRKYVNDRDGVIWLYLGYYRDQKQGKGIHSPKHCYPGSGWSMVEKGKETVSLGGDEPGNMVVNRVVFRKGNIKQLILYWFQSKERIVHDEYAQRWYLIQDAILLNRTDGALVKVYAPLADDMTEVLRDQKEFIRQIYPYLERGLFGQ